MMTEEQKKIHDLKFEIRQLRQRIDTMEEKGEAVRRAYDRVITDIFKTIITQQKLLDMLIGSLTKEEDNDI